MWLSCVAFFSSTHIELFQCNFFFSTADTRTSLTSLVVKGKEGYIFFAPGKYLQQAEQRPAYISLAPLTLQGQYICSELNAHTKKLSRSLRTPGDASATVQIDRS